MSNPIRHLRWLILVLYLASFAHAQSGQNPTPKRVLLFRQYGREAPAVVLFDRGFENALQSVPPGSIELYRETLESYRFPGESHEQLMRRYLKEKYSDRKIDVIVAHTDTALDFVVRNREELFPGVPVVYLISKRPEQGTEPPLSTGIWAGPNSKETLELALQLQPSTDQVFVIGGSLDEPTRLESETQEQLREFEQKVHLNYLVGRPLDELVATLKNLPSHSVVLCQVQTRGAEGRGVVPRDAVSLIAHAANVPVYGPYDSWIGDGIVGGRVVDHEDMGKRLAQMALRIANGAKPEEIPVQTAGLVPMFDWRELKRWRISESALPQGSVVLFKELTLWDRYRWQITGIAGLLILQALLIAWLLVNKVRRKRAEAESSRFALMVQEEHQRLEDVVSNVPGIVWESRLDPTKGKRVESFVSTQVEKILGYTVAEWLGAPRFWLSIIPENDRQRVLRESDAIFEQGNQGVIQFQWLTKDGRALWVESHLAAILGEGDKAVGLRGVTLDVTDRKLAEESLRESESRYRALVQATPQEVWVTDPDGRFGQEGWPWWEKLTGQGKENWEEWGWLEAIHPDDRQTVRDAWTEAHSTKTPYMAEYRIRSRVGDYGYYAAHAVPVWNGQHELYEWVGTIADVTKRKSEEAFLIGHNRILEMMASGLPLKEVLNNLVLLVEEQSARKTCSVLLLDKDGLHMRHGAAPNLPKEYVDAIDGAEIGPRAGSCGTAMYRGETVVVRDIFEDPLWDDYRDLAIMSGQRACWSTPIFSHAGKVIGSFAVYYREPRYPTEDAKRWVEVAAYLAHIAIDRYETEMTLRLSEERFEKAFKANPQPMFLTTLEDLRYVDVNESLVTVSGYTRDEILNGDSNPPDLWETPLQHTELIKMLQEKGSIQNLETRLRTKSGSSRVLLSSAELLEIGGENCILVASSDITERKQAEQSLATLTGRLLTSQDEERRRIARELHDSTAQQIGLMLLLLSRAKKHSTEMETRFKELVSESIQLGEESLKDIRTLSYVLHPPLLDQAGLATALRWYVKGFGERSGIKVDFSESGNIEGSRLPVDVEYSLYRVAQECLSNIRRHAKSATATIRLARSSDDVVLEVRDSGTSLRDGNLPNIDGGENVGVGIPGMRYRLTQLGGQLTVEPGPAGFRVTATVPLR